MRKFFLAAAVALTAVLFAGAPAFALDQVASPTFSPTSGASGATPPVPSNVNSTITRAEMAKIVAVAKFGG